jgi:hypothetical protein
MMLLAKHQIKGCGELYMRLAKDGPQDPAHGDYLIYCTRDGVTWVAWEAFPATDQVLGPSRIEPGIPLPEGDKISN